MMEITPAARIFLQTIGYTIFGLIIFGFAYWAMVKITPFSIRKEIEEDQNTALAIVMAAVIVGLALIISAALHG